MNKTYIKSYLVGQGMCTLIHNKDKGILLDCGAGTPIKRDEFLSNIKNNNLDDFYKDIKDLKSIKAIISHLDTDHYNLLCWSEELREKVKLIYTPDNQDNPNYFSRHLNRIKIKRINKNNSLFLEIGNIKIYGYRTQLKNANSKIKNDNCIVVLIQANNKNFLFPGDYLIKNFLEDKNETIKSLLCKKYEFICVPHHGSKDCIDQLTKKHHPSTSLAFFSAGDNKKYQHPDICSVKQYRSKGFDPLYVTKPKKIIYGVIYEI